MVETDCNNLTPFSLTQSVMCCPLHVILNSSANCSDPLLAEHRAYRFYLPNICSEMKFIQHWEQRSNLLKLIYSFRSICYGLVERVLRHMRV